MPPSQPDVVGSDVPPAQPAAPAPQAGTPEGEGESGDGGVSPSEVLGWLAVPLALWVGYRAYRLYRVTESNTQLVVADFGNSSGITALDGLAPGLSQLARERLLEEMKGLRTRVRVQAAGSEDGAPLLLKEAILLSAVVDPRLTDLIKAVAESVPEQAKPTVQLLALLFSPRGTRVNGRFQLAGDSPGVVGISFEIVDIEGLGEPEAETLWEEAPAVSDVPPDDGGEDGAPPGGNPPPGVREAMASYEVGRIYEGRGALEQAKTAYEEAAKKDPDNASARAALARVLASQRRTPQERYAALLEPAVRWLATELSRRVALEALRKRSPQLLRAKDTERREQGLPPLTDEEREQWTKKRIAEVYNFAGAYHMYGATDHSEFYRAAAINLARAIEESPEWYLPRENLGDLYSYTGEPTRAIGSYDAALGLQPLPEDVALRIRLAKGMAQMQSGDAALQQQAVSDTESDRQAIVAAPSQDARILYDLACWYAVAYAQGVVVPGAEAMAVGRRCLAASLARDRERELWDWAESDPDLLAIREGLGTFKSRLEAKLAQLPDLPEAGGEVFWGPIYQALAEADWS